MSERRTVATLSALALVLLIASAVRHRLDEERRCRMQWDQIIEYPVLAEMCKHADVRAALLAGVVVTARAK